LGQRVNNLLTFGLMFNVLLFVIPGLVVYGIGAAISRRRQSAAGSQSKTVLTETPSTTVEDCLNELLELKDKKLITFCTLSLRRIRSGKIRLFEGFASFRPKGIRSSHEADAICLREVAWNPERYTGAVVAPEDFALTSTDVLSSAFRVAGMGFGVPPVVKIDG